jgi:hypothetical protein
MPSYGVQSARLEYEGLGFDTLPLKPGAKETNILDWQNQSPYRLWRYALPEANIGLRAGGEVGAAFLDCDEARQPGTFATAQQWLAGLGYLPGEYPVVRTCSQVGRHIYLILDGHLEGSYRRLAAGFGAGEFRYGPGAYVVAPPSQVDGGSYALLDGDYRQLPKLTVADVLPILANLETTAEPEVTKPSIPRRARGLLQGKNLERYRSRSEAEQSLIVSLINAGHRFESVLSMFLAYPCAGKFKELYAKSEHRAIAWLQHSYDEAKLYAESHESKARQQVRAVMTWAASIPWPGRTGAVDQQVFLAHLQISLRAGRLTYAASSRELAELAGIVFTTAIRSTHRLCQAGFIALDTEAVADCAHIYRLLHAGQTETLPHTEELRECCSLSRHDAFRFRGLGKSAASWSSYGRRVVSADWPTQEDGEARSGANGWAGRHANRSGHADGCPGWGDLACAGGRFGPSRPGGQYKRNRGAAAALSPTRPPGP